MKKFFRILFVISMTFGAIAAEAQPPPPLQDYFRTFLDGWKAQLQAAIEHNNKSWLKKNYVWLCKPHDLVLGRSALFQKLMNVMDRHPDVITEVPWPGSNCELNVRASNFTRALQRIAEFEDAELKMPICKIELPPASRSYALPYITDAEGWIVGEIPLPPHGNSQEGIDEAMKKTLALDITTFTEYAEICKYAGTIIYGNCMITRDKSGYYSDSAPYVVFELHSEKVLAEAKTKKDALDQARNEQRLVCQPDSQR
jgi:hypothetical protein